VGGIALLFVVIGWLVLAAVKREKQKTALPGTPERTAESPNSSVYTKTNPKPAAAEDGFMEVAFTAPDDVSTLGEPFGTTDQNYILQDESTASVAMSSLLGEEFLTHDPEGGSRTEASVSTSSAATTDIDIDKLLPGDDESFDQLFTNASAMTATGMDVLRYDVQVPPGRIGMMLDAGFPRVNAIKPDSIFATRNVQVGDYLVSLDEVDVRGMEPMDVSRMIVMRSKQPRRVFTFERR
jgi:hypothetical protein